jgi:hypothetical protein
LKGRLDLADETGSDILGCFGGQPGPDFNQIIFR